MKIIFILSIHNGIFEFWVGIFRHDSAVFFFLLFVFFVYWFISLGLFKEHNSLQFIFIELWHALNEQPLLDLKEDASILPPHHFLGFLFVVLFVFKFDFSP